MKDFQTAKNKIIQLLDYGVDLLLLGLLWLVFSVPIVTIGAAATAFYYVATKRAVQKEGHMFKDFIRSFRLNLLSATGYWLGLAALFVLLWLNMHLVDQFEHVELRQIFQVLETGMGIILFFIAIYLFPLLARFEMKGGQLIKTAFFLSWRHLPTSLCCGGLFVVSLALTWFTGYFLFFFMGIYGGYSARVFVGIFQKYRPDLDDPE